MANAWCINAIWFDWTLIQTLQQLDSANIWVWIQYTAPSPLDDKRLDYIKYTDKCWNTCCITWENELLIYATQWTLKNLTLTNDDANEVVNVKRTDLFWSNRKKTVVRYKTWWYPTSITDWTLAVEELVQNQYQSSWYNVSWLEDWTTYYFSAFAVAQDDTIIVVQTNSITPEYWRKPWENTIAYYKLDWNWNDSSWNWRNLTASNISYETLSSWLKVAYFNWNSSLKSTFTEFWLTELTVNIRIKKMRNVNWECPIAVRDDASYDAELSIRSLSTTQWNIWSQYYQNATKRQWRKDTWISNWTRMNVMFTVSTSWNKFYVNWSEVSLTYSSWNSNVWLQNAKTNMIIFWRHPVVSADRFQWYVSQAIIEKKIRTATEWIDYYNKTKRLYWF